MRKVSILVVLVGVAAFTAVSLANSGSGGVIQAEVPGEAKTLDAHRLTTAQAIGVNASAKPSQFNVRYFLADVTVAPGETDGGAIKCPKTWHPVSGLFSSESDGVLAASDAPLFRNKWAVFVLNQGNTQATVTIGAVCAKVPVS